MTAHAGRDTSRSETDHRIVGLLWQRIGSVLSLAMRCGDERVEVRGRYVLAVDDGNAHLAGRVAGLGVL